MRTMSRLLWSACALACLVASPGCVDMAQVQQARDQAAALRDDLRAQSEELARLATELPQGTPEVDRSRILTRAQAAAADAATLDAAVRQVDLVLNEANNPQEPISQAVGAIAPWLPPPWRTPVVLSAALAATLLRARSLKVGMTSIIRGLDRAMRTDEDFRQRFMDHADTFRATQTALAQRLVDQVTRPPAVKLPI